MVKLGEGDLKSPSVFIAVQGLQLIYYMMLYNHVYE